MWNQIFLLYAALGAAFSATLFHCQERSNCQLPGNHVEATTFEFLSKFSQKQFRTIVSLSMSNASVNKVDPKLKYLKNLKYLDLSYNNVQILSIPPLINLKTLKLNGNSLKYINMTALPQNIETLDISHNLLVQIPKDWRSLRSLKTLHLYKNPVDCDCNNVLNYDRLVKSGIVVPEAVTCHSPKKYIGKDISAVNCSLDDIMLYDEPDLGSGDLLEEDINEDGMHVPLVQEKEDEDLQENNTFIDDQLPQEELIPAEATEETLGETLDEGSGDEGSGFYVNFHKDTLGCIEDCSTPGPIGTNDEEHASPLPSPIDQAKILFDDINIFKEPTTTGSTTTPTTTTPTPVIEPRIVKTAAPTVKASPKNDDVEVIAHATKTGELERASVAPENSTAVYAIIGVGLFLAVVFMICFIKKRRAKNRRELPNSIGQEMIPLSKPINEKPLLNSSNAPEHVPLINGQNGKPKDDTPILKTFTPLTHPETVQEEEEEPEQENNQRELPNDVELRQKFTSELLTPPRERVTIKETEIPDSIPKTPLLVHRQRNSDGEIVTTLVP
ncbi:protein windpipe [Anoplophora glabripennis]|uniref:protein windpipe n=1 Tax=Anoplophora glabripennis TaxID=217634 RepID=UPI0008744846|nr:protein windpipe [Anoplophora glabripennis]